MNTASDTDISLSRDTLYLAPMLGITDSAYRAAFMKCFGGFDCAIAPFVKTLQGGRWEERKLADVFPAQNKALPVFPQILSNNSEDFIALARELFAIGYEKINVNFGCPVPMAAGRGRGAGLLPHPEFVDRLLDEICAAIPNQLSIKTRIGFDSPAQLFAMTKVFNRYPLFEIAIHPRTAVQGYGGAVNHEAFAEAASQLKAGVVYSGDINSVNDFVAVRERYPSLRKWMLGRGALANPFLPRMIKRYLAGESLAAASEVLQLSDLSDFYAELIYQYDERGVEANVILARLKTVFYYQAAFLNCDKAMVRGARKARSTDELQRLLYRPEPRSTCRA